VYVLVAEENNNSLLKNISEEVAPKGQPLLIAVCSEIEISEYQSGLKSG
jgi:subtilase family serine protease